MAYLLLHQEGHSLAQEAGQSVCEVVDQYIVAAQQGERGVGWVAGAFSLDHCGNVSLDIGFNFDTSQEVQGSLQVDHLANERQDQGDVSGDRSFRLRPLPSEVSSALTSRMWELLIFNLKALSLRQRILGRILERAFFHQFFHYLDLLFGQ